MARFPFGQTRRKEAFHLHLNSNAFERILDGAFKREFGKASMFLALR